VTERGAETIQSDKDALASGTTTAELWLKKIKRAQDDEKKWREEAKEAVAAYEASEEKQPISFNIFHSNVETLIPALYNSSPVPDVRRRFGDADPIAKQVVDLSERSISYSIDQYDIDETFVAVIRDASVTGRGVARVVYSAYQNGYQETTCERVVWDKFIRGPARSWAKVPWIAFEHDLTKDELAKLNETKAAKLQLGEAGDKSDNDTSKDPAGVLKTRLVYEIWDKKSRKVIFVDDQKEIWKEGDDPLRLPDFFPVLQPLQPVKRPSSLTPVCQYTVYKPLIDELDVVTKRISKLVKQLKVRGLIDGEMSPDFEQLKNCEDGQYVAASNAGQFASQGGLEKSIAHWPMEPIVKALQQVYIQRDAIKQTIYEVTGIADILRGATDPNETLGAQQIKQQWGSLRIQRLQNEVARLARELFRAKVALYATHFTDQNLRMMTGLPQNQEQEKAWPEVLKVFRSDARSYRIDIETDSTIRADMTRNQEQMNQFLAGTAQFAQGMAGLIQIPQIGQGALPVMVEVFTSFARKFKLGKQAEDALDKLSQITQQMAQQPQQEQPNPEAEKIKMEMQAAQQKNALDMQAMQARTQNDATAMQMKAQHDERMMQLDERKAQMEIELKQIELQLKREEMAIKAQGQAQQAAFDQQARQEEHAFAHQERTEEAQFNRQERQENRQMMHETNDAKRQGMADKAKFDKQRMAQKAKQGPEARA
jgi:hypothetical protein